MNQKEWKTSGRFKGKFEWYNKTRKLQKLLNYNPDPNAKVIHHLRDTEEQRKYNDEHYELWGFNEDGTFEYGKYVIFVTEEWHNNYHSQSEETKVKIGKSISKLWDNQEFYESHSGKNSPSFGRKHTEESKLKMSFIAKSRPPKSEEHRKHLSESGKGKHFGENNGMYGKRGVNNPLFNIARPEEVREKISNSKKGYTHSDETRKKMSESAKHRKVKTVRSSEYKDESSKRLKALHEDYLEYKSNGGTMTWNEYQHFIKCNKQGNHE